MQAEFTAADFARYPGDVYGPYKGWLSGLNDDELTKEEDRTKAAFLHCDGEHDRTKNPRYALACDAWEMTQMEWDKRNNQRDMFAAIARRA